MMLYICTKFLENISRASELLSQHKIMMDGQTGDFYRASADFIWRGPYDEKNHYCMPVKTSEDQSGLLGGELVCLLMNTFGDKAAVN